MANTDKFINEHKAIAISEAVRTGIPASITMAQAILESGWGESGLTVNANNYFGVKADSSWKGPVYNTMTGEVYSGQSVVVNANFRKYNDARDSFKDHSNFLVDMPRYDGLFAFGITDYENWAKGLQSAGYATSPTYASKLISLVEQYGLQDLDKKAKVRRRTIGFIIIVGILVGIYAAYKIISSALN
jgi:flagellum-specific peptidoglycan hydrolase FlgJ